MNDAAIKTKCDRVVLYRASCVCPGVAAALIVVAGWQVALGQQMAPRIIDILGEQEGASISTVASTNTPSRAEQPPDGDFNEIRNNRGMQQIVQVLARHMEEPKDVDIEIWLNNDGKITFAAVYKEGRAKDALVPEPSKESRGKIEPLLKNLGADKFALRESATKELITRGLAILATVKEFKQGQTDPEVILRCDQIIAAVDILAALPDYEGAMREIKTVSYESEKYLWGKRYVGSIGADIFNRWIRRGRNMMIR